MTSRGIFDDYSFKEKHFECNNFQGNIEKWMSKWMNAKKEWKIETSSVCKFPRLKTWIIGIKLKQDEM